MSVKTILFVENHVEFLDTRAEFLERAGYRVLKANSPEEVKRKLAMNWVHLLIVDIRLESDNDAEDNSGIEIAREPMYQLIPKIILTSYPSYEYVREVMRRGAAELPPAVDFLSKRDGPQMMLQAVEEAFTRYVRANFELKFEFQELLSFRDWARQIMNGDLDETFLGAWAEEIETLVRQVFYDYTDIKLDNVPLRRVGEARAWVTSENGPGRWLLKVGKREEIGTQQERRSYSDAWGLNLVAQQTGRHFAAAVYGPIKSEAEPVQWLLDYIVWHKPNEIADVVEDLFRKCEEFLYWQPCEPGEGLSLNAAYKQLTKLDSVPRSDFQKSMSDLMMNLRQQYGISLDDDGDGSLLFHFPNGGELRGLDPTSIIYDERVQIGPPISWQYSLGNMDGFNLLVDKEGQVWLTDFRFIAPAPMLADFVALEAKLRFDWAEDVDWDSLLQSEPLLNQIELPGREDLDSRWIGNAKVIDTIRRAARRRTDVPEIYHLALLYHAAQRMLASELSVRLRGFLAAAMIAKNLLGMRDDSSTLEKTSE